MHGSPAVWSLIRDRSWLRPRPRGGALDRRLRQRLARTLLLAAGVWLCVPGLSGLSALAATPTHQTDRPRHPTEAPAEFTLPLSVAHSGAQITMPPVGLSVEYPVMADDLGTGACPPPALVAELRRLGSPPLALTGDSQDLTAPPGVLSSPPPSWEAATVHSIPASFWSQLHCLLSGAGDPLDVGLNLRTGTPSWAAQMEAGAQSAATNGLEFSLGNEPDLYSLPNYVSLALPLRNAEAATVDLYLQLATAMQQAIGAAPVIGPELATAARWRRQLPRVITKLHDQTVGVHLYPLSACDGPSAVTIRRLLSPAVAEAPRSLAWVVADANAAKVPAIISESNSASCGGEQGVSDSPASAVWAVRFVLAALKTGFREVRFHFSDGPYDPFVVQGERVIERPIESSLVALNHWLGIGDSIETLHSTRGLVATAIAGAPAARSSSSTTRRTGDARSCSG